MIIFVILLLTVIIMAVGGLIAIGKKTWEEEDFIDEITNNASWLKDNVKDN